MAQEARQSGNPAAGHFAPAILGLCKVLVRSLVRLCTLHALSPPPIRSRRGISKREPDPDCQLSSAGRQIPRQSQPSAPAKSVLLKLTPKLVILCLRHRDLARLLAGPLEAPRLQKPAAVHCIWHCEAVEPSHPSLLPRELRSSSLRSCRTGRRQREGAKRFKLA